MHQASHQNFLEQEPAEFGPRKSHYLIALPSTEFSAGQFTIDYVFSDVDSASSSASPQTIVSNKSAASVPMAESDSAREGCTFFLVSDVRAAWCSLAGSIDVQEGHSSRTASDEVGQVRPLDPSAWTATPEADRLVRITAVSFLRKRAFMAQDLEDFCQDLRLHLLQRISKFNPTRGSLAAFSQIVLRRGAQTLIRDRRIRKRNPAVSTALDTPLRSLGGEDQLLTPVNHHRRRQCYPRSPEEVTQLAWDVAEAAKKFTPRQRRLADFLKSGLSLTEAAQEESMPRQTSQDELARMRSKFTKDGLRTYAGLDPRINSKKGRKKA